jgi:two-component system NtrC family sensor kinase
MRHSNDIPLVTTIREHCRTCYTCVRECPAKAIRITDGQAEVLPTRCIGCGNCVRVCSQHAKSVLDSITTTRELLRGPGRVAAIVAPSFPAAFDCTDRQLVGMIKALGFDMVCEVAFGADLVADRYRQLLSNKDDKRYIATSCPAVVAFVERYHPSMVDNLVPIVSPMIAEARLLRQRHGNELKIVFIGPCIAKKGEAASEHLSDRIDAALTFVELQALFNVRRLDPDEIEPSPFDPPRAGTGAMFAISRGMLQAANISEDLVDGMVIATDGRSELVDAMKEFEAGHLDVRLLEILACNGCFMGPGMPTDGPLFSRRSKVSKYVRNKMEKFDADAWQKDMDRHKDLDLSRTFHPFDQRIDTPSTPHIEAVMERMGKFDPTDELNCGACGYDSCREHAIAVLKGLAESEMCLPHSIEEMNKTLAQLAASNEELANTQEALMQSEKLASMGQLAAGIAHEVNNPLGVVLMYSHLLREEHVDDEKLNEDLTMISEQADRCKKIVAGLLHFARQNKIIRQPENIHELLTKTASTLTPPENVNVVLQREGDGMMELDRDQMVQVLTNLITNAYAAMPDGGTLTLRTESTEDEGKFVVQDTGTGIPEENRAKIFDPFFTTKQIGKGTGLGLAVTYGIVKMHRGQIDVTSNDDPSAGPTGTTFTITLPKHTEPEPLQSVSGDDEEAIRI